MSYCCDIALMLKADIVDRFNQYVSKYDNDLKEVSTFLQVCKQRLISKDGDVLYYWNYYKNWRYFYPSAFAIQRFMNHLDDENLSDHYLFIRLGEEWDDVEYRG